MVNVKFRRLSVVLLVAGLATTGCIEYHIEAPHRSIVLARGKQVQAMQLALSLNRPTYQSRQFSFFPMFPLYTAGIGSLNPHSFSSGMYRDMNDAVIVGGHHLPDVLISIVSFTYVSSNTVRVYENVE